MHNIGNNGNIATFVFLYICSLFLDSNCIVQVNGIFYITWHKRNTFQSWLLWWPNKFPNGTAKTQMAKLAFLYCREFVKTLTYFRKMENVYILN